MLAMVSKGLKVAFDYWSYIQPPRVCSVSRPKPLREPHYYCIDLLLQQLVAFFPEHCLSLVRPRPQRRLFFAFRFISLLQATEAAGLPQKLLPSPMCSL